MIDDGFIKYTETNLKVKDVDLQKIFQSTPHIHPDHEHILTLSGNTMGEVFDSMVEISGSAVPNRSAWSVMLKEDRKLDCYYENLKSLPLNERHSYKKENL